MNFTEQLSKLFDDAKQKDEFEYVCTLINFKGMGYRNDTTNLHEWFELIEFYKDLYSTQTEVPKKARIGLALYSHFFECSDLYNIIGSLARTILGYRASSFLYYKHAGSDRWLETGVKISMLKSLLLDIGSEQIIDFFEFNYSKELRNSFIHSAYSLIDGTHYNVNDGDPIKEGGISKSYVSIQDYILPRIENIIKFFEAFKLYYQTGYNSYQEEKSIVGRFPDIQPITIVGSSAGLRGYRTNGASVEMDNSNTWMAMNIFFSRVTEEAKYISDELNRYDKKNGSYKDSDSALEKLQELVIRRNINTEKIDLSIIFAQGADYRRNAARQEENTFKKKKWFEQSILKYDQSIQLNDKNYPAIQNRAITMIQFSEEIGLTAEVMNKAYDDIFYCWSDLQEFSLADNLFKILKSMKSHGFDYIDKKNQLQLEIVSKTDQDFSNLNSQILEL